MERDSWSTYRLRGTPAASVGVVYASDEKDEKSAIEKAIKFKIDPAQLWQMIAKPGRA